MLTGKTGNSGFIREMNQKLIINAIRRNPKISRSELSKLLNLSEPSVSRIIDVLLKKNILLEIGEGDSGGGRKPIMLKLNERYKVVVGVDYSSKNIRVAMGDLEGKLIDIEYFKRSRKMIDHQVLVQTIQCIKNLLERNRMDEEDLAVITIGAPGVINNETGEIVVKSGWFNHEENIDLNEIFGAEFRAKINIINDIKLAALGESRYGEGEKVNNLIYISVDTGVGSGIIIDREIYFGSNHATGEIGYWITSIEGVENTGTSGKFMLENKISITALLDEVKSDLENGQQSYLLELIDNDIEKISFEIFKKAVSENDKYCIEKVIKLGRHLAWAIINIVCLLGIDTVVIGGEASQLGTCLIKSIHDIFDNYIPKPISVNVVCTNLNSRAGILGAFVLGLNYAFDNVVF